jgi:hypothetical protein
MQSRRPFWVGMRERAKVLDFLCTVRPMLALDTTAQSTFAPFGHYGVAGSS